jgi:hypothetical protein
MHKNSVWLGIAGRIPARLGAVAVFLFVFCCGVSRTAAATCHTVTPSGSGSNSGADWNNAYAGLPSSLVRGDIYYLADGNYGNHLTLSQADSGTLTIELRKAQSYDYGQNSATCSNSSTIVAGWKASTMGAAQAVWNQSTSSPRTIVSQTSDYWIINGNGNSTGGTDKNVGCGGIQTGAGSAVSGMLNGPPIASACGIKIDDSSCTSTATNGCDGGSGIINGCGTNTVWEYNEWFGQGLNSDGNNNSETYFRRCAHSVSGEQFHHIYGHNAGTTYITMTSESNANIYNNYFWGLFDGSANHGEALQDTGGDSGTNVYYNFFRDQCNTDSSSLGTNGDLVFVSPVTGTHNNWAIYGNVDFASSGVTTCIHHDGFIACINTTQTCTNFLVVQNTLIGLGNNCGIVLTNASTDSFAVYNNLFYDCAGATVGGTGLTESDNSFLNTSGSTGTNNVNIKSGAPDPFVNWQTGNIALVSDNADWNGRIATALDPLKDIYGNQFTTDRGAVQFAPTNTPLPPVNVTGSATPQP